MRLDELSTGQSAIVIKILGHGAFRKRLIEMGFVRGREIKVLLHAPMHDPIKYGIMDYEVSLRRTEAHMIEVVPAEEISAAEKEPRVDTLVEDAPPSLPADNSDGRRTINIALIGNPNCGKTSLFNIASGAREHVGNYSGVTVDAKYGKLDYGGYHINIVDLPGTYSLDSYSPEELYVRRYLADETPDVIVNVVVASNLERNLYLTTELIDMDRRMVVALNMYDELERSDDKLDHKLLGKMLGVPMVPTVSRTGRGVDQLFDTIIKVFEDRHEAVRHVHVNLGNVIEPCVSVLKDRLKADRHVPPQFSPRYLAIKLLEHDKEAETIVGAIPDIDTVLQMRDTEVKNIESYLQEDVTSSIAGQKYGFISGALAETLTKGTREVERSTHVIDAFVTNKLFGFPIFLAIMFFTFWATFEIGSYPMDWIESLVQWIGDMVQQHMPAGGLKDLIADGIIGGVGGVIVFLPNILILYLCISFMEDSGYMARAAFIMDKIMHRMGLHGKSFIPLVMGFGCNVPAIMSARSIESHSSRIITILINPFMSCSARLPVYVLMVGTFFERHAALVFLLLYFTGIAVAMITARLLRKFHFKTDETPFVMELPPYRLPTLRTSLRHMWGKGEQYLRKMGGVILVASIIVWALNYFPIHNHETQPIVAENSTPADDSAIDTSSDSYLQMLGKAVNPIMEPLGIHWRGTVALLAGIPAKEIVCSTLGVLYTGDEDASDSTLSARINETNPSTGQPDFTPASALAFILFVLLYCPCMATIVAIIKETGRWQYGVFSVIYNTAVAWIIAFAAYRIMLLF